MNFFQYENLNHRIIKIKINFKNYSSTYKMINICSIFVMCHKIQKPMNMDASILTSALNFKSFRSSRPGVFCKRGILKNFAKFTGKRLCQRLKKKKSHWHRCFPLIFAKFLRTQFFQNTSGGCFWSVNSHNHYHDSLICYGCLLSLTSIRHVWNNFKENFLRD